MTAPAHRPALIVADRWRDYALLDAGDGLKQERWGEFTLVRPDPQIIWPRSGGGEKNRMQVGETGTAFNNAAIPVGVNGNIAVPSPTTGKFPMNRSGSRSRFTRRPSSTPASFLSRP